MRYANAVESAMQGVEAVVHLAAVCINKSISDPTESLDVNLLGTQNVYDAAARASVRADRLRLVGFGVRQPERRCRCARPTRRRR